MTRRVVTTCLPVILTVAPAFAQMPNALTPEERAAGWKLLFDGTTTAGRRGFQRPAFPADG